MNKITLILILGIYFNCISQTNFSNNTFVKENIVNRGYEEPRLIYKNDKVGYYWVKSVSTARDNRGFFHLKDKPLVIAVHDIKEDELILDLKNRGDTYGSWEYINPNKEVNFLKLNIISNFPNARWVFIRHYVKNYFFTELQVDYNQGSKYELPIISEKFQKTGLDFKAWPSFGMNANNSISDALKKRKSVQQSKKEKNYKIELEAFYAKRIKMFHEKNGYLYKDSTFWNKFNTQSKMLKAIYEGDFKKIREGKHVDYRCASTLINIYMAHLSSSCKTLLPSNFKTLAFETTTGGQAKYTGFYFTSTNGSFINNYEYDPSETQINKIHLDPKLESIYMKKSDEFRETYRNILLYNAWDLKNWNNELEDIYAFFHEIGCNKKFLSLLGNNLYRFSKNEESVQFENGVYTK